MLAKDFILEEFPVLNSFDTAAYALSVMDDMKVKHLPVVVNEVYRCLLEEKDWLEMAEPAAVVGEAVLFAPSVTGSEHLHEIVARMAGYRLSLLPVVDREGKYRGVITRDKLFDALAEGCNAETPGSVVCLELLPQDFALSDIARIVEANNAHVLNLLSNTDEQTGRLIVTLKTDLENSSPLIRSFERFNYTVLYHFIKTEVVDEGLQRRMDELIYYMTM